MIHFDYRLDYRRRHLYHHHHCFPFRGLPRAVEEGDSVTAGQVIGTVGAPTAYYVEEGPNVYFAVSKDGTPIDPTEYLAE